MKKSEGGRPLKTAATMSVVSEYRQALEDNELSERTAERWQLGAEVPEGVFEQHVAETKAAKEELTSIGLRRLAQRLRQREDYSRAANWPVCSQPEAAQMLNVGERSIRRAKKVLTEGTGGPADATALEVK